MFLLCPSTCDPLICIYVPLGRLHGKVRPDTIRCRMRKQGQFALHRPVIVGAAQVLEPRLIHTPQILGDPIEGGEVEMSHPLPCKPCEATGSVRACAVYNPGSPGRALLVGHLQGKVVPLLVVTCQTHTTLSSERRDGVGR